MQAGDDVSDYELEDIYRSTSSVAARINRLRTESTNEMLVYSLPSSNYMLKC